MKIGVFILLTLLGTGVSAGSINSAVYDLKVTDEAVEGFCLIRGQDMDADFSPGWSDSIVEKEGDMVVLRFKSNFSNHDVEIPLLEFPCRVEKTLVVVSTRKKFLWRVDSQFYSLGRGDRLLVEDEMERNAISELDSELENLRDILGSERSHLSENRIYLKEINTGEEKIINAWAGKGYEYSLQYIFGAVILCILLFAAFYFISKRL
ncbi:MAG: hypothetical protein A7315_14670 [Candidatus Altiarchaeales archaeon WOR_SM1_79]|nr:MAG: hypothetical protein A7315_14670 [Candidatus Altiarchaeales archaeon WOR_SM1_79]